MKATITNSFHGTSTTVATRDDGTITQRQATRVWRDLCGIKGCTCGGALGERGWQDVAINYGQAANGSLFVQITPAEE